MLGRWMGHHGLWKRLMMARAAPRYWCLASFSLKSLKNLSSQGCDEQANPLTSLVCHTPQSDLMYSQNDEVDKFNIFGICGIRFVLLGCALQSDINVECFAKCLPSLSLCFLWESRCWRAAYKCPVGDDDLSGFAEWLSAEWMISSFNTTFILRQLSRW